MKRSEENFFRNRETIDQGNQIFSVGGTPSFRLNRREQVCSNVFPAGCMGNKTTLEESETKSELPSPKQSKEEIVAEKKEEVDELEDDDFERAGGSEGYVWKRNPLTGEGVEVEKPRKHKKGPRKRLNKWVW